MKKTISVRTILSLCFLVVVLTACASGGLTWGASNANQIVTNTNYRTGTSSVEISMIKEVTPEIIYIEEPFNFGLYVKNVGATDIAEGKIFLSGYEKTMYNFTPSIQTFSAVGKSIYRAQREETQVMFDGKSLCFPAAAKGMIKNFTNSFRITACYPYSTNASTELCINPFVSSKTDKSSCESKTISLSGGQGGPVGVESITPRIIRMGDDIQLKVDVSVKQLNKDETVFGEEYYKEGCQDVRSKNKVTIKISLRDQECVPQQVTLVNGQGQSSCIFQIDPAEGSFTTPVNVDILYAVSKSMVQKILVQQGAQGYRNVCVA